MSSMSNLSQRKFYLLLLGGIILFAGGIGVWAVWCSATYNYEDNPFLWIGISSLALISPTGLFIILYLWGYKKGKNRIKSDKLYIFKTGLLKQIMIEGPWKKWLAGIFCFWLFVGWITKFKDCGVMGGFIGFAFWATIFSSIHFMIAYLSYCYGKQSGYRDIRE